MALRQSLIEFPFDASGFDALRAAYLRGELRPSTARLKSAPQALSTLQDDPRWRPNESISQSVRDALKRGELAAVIMNGGMATRFGGVAKGITAALEAEHAPTQSERSFLSLKLDACRSEQVVGESAQVPVVIMNSFATQAASLHHLESENWRGLADHHRFHFTQSILPRVDQDGEAIINRSDADRFGDREAYAPPGHGDTLKRLRESGVVQKLKAQGVRHVMISNVDNLGATPDPAVFAAHLAAYEKGHQLSVEVVPRLSADKGGCVAVVDGKAIIVEGFRLPENCDGSQYPEFNTNTLWFAIEALEQTLELSWFAVERKIRRDDDLEIPAVQFEQLIGQASERLPTAYLEVSRNERFLPIKTREDLQRAQPQIAQWAKTWG